MSAVDQNIVKIGNTINIENHYCIDHRMPKYVDVNNGFVWIAAAYLGYLGGVHFTKLKGDKAWQFLSFEVQKIKDKLRKK